MDRLETQDWTGNIRDKWQGVMSVILPEFRSTSGKNSDAATAGKKDATTDWFSTSAKRI